LALAAAAVKEVLLAAAVAKLQPVLVVPEASYRDDNAPCNNAPYNNNARGDNVFCISFSAQKN
jgi:hypothetical protein